MSEFKPIDTLDTLRSSLLPVIKVSSSPSEDSFSCSGVLLLAYETSESELLEEETAAEELETEEDEEPPRIALLLFEAEL